jgi:hypothetical protein
MKFLVSDSRRRTVTWKHVGFVRKRVKFLRDVGDQGLMVAPGQIGAADATSKKDVAAHQDLLARQIKAKAARAMAWN